MVLFTVDAAQRLFDVQPAALHDRFLDANEELDESWWPMLEALRGTSDDATTMKTLEQYIGGRLPASRSAPTAMPSLRQAGSLWLQGIAGQAGKGERIHGVRQVERRMKALSGRSMREWQSLLKAENIFFSARDRYEAGLPFDWADLAAAEGFADQAHLARSVKRITGFAPTDFARRYISDESFWFYRLWV